MKLFFQYSRARDQINLDISNNLLTNYPTFTDPRDSLRKNIIKPKRNFDAFKEPIVSSASTRSMSMFQRGIIENVTGPTDNCSSCGGAK